MNRAGTVTIIAIIIGIIAVAVAITQAIELSAPAMFILILGMGLGAFVIWDNVLFRDVDTIKEIVRDHNVALAIFYLIPALLILSASLAL